MADAIDLLVVILLGIWILTIVVLCVRDFFKGTNPDKLVYEVRVSLGSLILLALELLIVSDVLHSIASRTLEDLGIVAALVVIRVFMAYFLDKELERLTEKRKTASED
ncbi:MAG: DUF1622 domain-containing protein [Dinoroseobacter sp.]|nr:DUF1622 domain-containing protein [Dinoroseobacter sp.]